MAVCFALAATTGLTIAPAGVAPVHISDKASRCSKYKIGKITQARQTTVHGTQAYRGRQLRAGDHLVTSENGDAKFCLLQKGTSCEAEAESHLILQPKQNVIIRYQAPSDVSCNTTKRMRKGKPSKWCSKSACITAKDPLFTVVVTRKKTTVKVVSGLVQFKSAHRTVLVGSHQQSTAKAGKKPQRPVGIHQTAAERAATKSLAKQSVPPNYSRPPSDDSPTLQRLANTRTIRVGVDLSDSKDRWRDNEETFVSTYFKFLADNWRLKLSMSRFRKTPEQIGDALAAGQIDVAVTPQYIYQVETFALPLFTNPSEVEWDIDGPHDDDGLLAGLNRFVSATVDAGAYGDYFFSAFHRQPSYFIFWSG
jgi:hypothetical protein